MRYIYLAIAVIVLLIGIVAGQNWQDWYYGWNNMYAQSYYWFNYYDQQYYQNVYNIHQNMGYITRGW